MGRERVRLAAVFDDGPSHIGELDVQVLGVAPQHVERLLLVDVVQQHQHADGLADFAVAEQSASQGGGVFALGDGVDGHARERCQHDGLSGGFGVEDVGGVAEQVERTGFALDRPAAGIPWRRVPASRRPGAAASLGHWEGVVRSGFDLRGFFLDRVDARPVAGAAVRSRRFAARRWSLAPTVT